MDEIRCKRQFPTHHPTRPESLWPDITEAIKPEFEGKRTSFVLSGGGGQSLHDVKVNGRGPFGEKVHGFTHLQVSKKKFTVRHLDGDRKQVHAFSKTPDGKIEFLS